jgi:hypothetical protein
MGLNKRIEQHRRGGREDFLAEQSQRWDRFYTRPHHLVTGMVVGIFGAVLVFGIYELLVAGVYLMVRSHLSNDKPS